MTGTRDRSWSLRLVQELARGMECDREKIIETLSELEHKRTEHPLLALVTDTLSLQEALVSCGVCG